ncbi:MAG: S1 family peptidase [Solirubrobacteraceae bacterium]
MTRPSHTALAKRDRISRANHTATATLLAVMLFVLAQAAPAAGRQSRIVHGSNASLKTWPWMARVLINNPTGSNTCTGTVVAPNVVLTAGHCASAAWRFEVITGTTSTSVGGQTSAVSRVVRDPSYRVVAPNGADLTDYDATLLQLKTPTTVPPVPLATAADRSLYAAGTPVWVSGWGWPSYASGTVSPTLLETDMAMAGEPQCKSDSQTSFGLPLDTADQICADSPSKTTGICEGDSGGPLMARDANGLRVEIGLVIWNSGDCTTRAPDYFTSISGISGWLAKEISVLSGRPLFPEQRPRAGTYHGRTGQQQPLSVTLAPSRLDVNSVSVSVKLRCSRRHAGLLYTAHPGGTDWPLDSASAAGVGLTHRFHGVAGMSVTLQAAFTMHGTVTGTVEVRGSNRQDGSCASRPVLWTASLR